MRTSLFPLIFMLMFAPDFVAVRSANFVCNRDNSGEPGAISVREDKRMIVTFTCDELMRVFAVRT